MNALHNLFSRGSKTHENQHVAHAAQAPKHTEESNGEASQLAKRVYHLIVLDESGSMSGVQRQTIDGCNETIKTVRKLQKGNEEQQHFISIYLFDSGNSRYIVKNQPVDAVRDITSQDYCPNSCTPLYDALGDTLTDLTPLIEAGAMGYVTIITDGYENDSSRYTLDMVRKLIAQLKQMDVIFTFIGANIDAKAYASSLEIENSMQFQEDERGTQEMWERERKHRMASQARMRYINRYRHDISRENFGARENAGHYYAEQDDASRITPALITSLASNEVFVFGSAIDGSHGGGAAGMAVQRFGAVVGQAEGLQGQSYAIPTVGVSESQLNEAVQRFCVFAARHPELTFLVTPIGCGNAMRTPFDVAPMFLEAVRLPNVKLPQAFWEILGTVVY